MVRLENLTSRASLTYIIGIPALAGAFSEHSDPYSSFMPLLTQSNDPESPIPLLTSTVLASMISGAKVVSENESKALPGLFTYLSTLTKQTDGGLQDIAVLQYSALLRGKKSRQLFWEQRDQTVAPLIDILRAAAGVQNGDSTATLWNGTASMSLFPYSFSVFCMRASGSGSP
jgi:V-type H+-transporting ATPase subunit H